MDEAELERAQEEFRRFHDHFAPLFGREEARDRSQQYLLGLLVQASERRNAENLAEVVEESNARVLQRFLTESPWAWHPLIMALQAYLSPRLSAAEGVFIIDETCFPKQGAASVGVARQYCGTLGKVANCQIGVFLAYAAPRGYALIDMRLYLPEGWITDAVRRQQTGIPPEVIYRSKAELALALLEQARQAGFLTGHWVTGDEAYGEVPTFRDALDGAHWWYVLEVPSTTPLFEQLAKTEIPPWSGKGRKPTTPRLVAGEARPQPVAALAERLAPSAWQTLTVADGAQGPRTYQFAAQRVWESRDGLPGRACWVLFRRNLDGSELKYCVSNAPLDTPLLTLGRVGATRWCIETAFQRTKDEIGLADYEVRSWRAWHHHITLALLAGAFLFTMWQEWGKKSAPADSPAGQSAPPGQPASAALVSSGSSSLD